MNAFERLMGTVQGQPVDRPPVIATLGAYGGHLAGLDLRQLYTDPDAWFLGQQRLQALLGFDMVMCPFDHSAISEAFGGEVEFFANQAPNLKRAPVCCVEDALALALPDVNEGRPAFILEATRKLSAEYHGTVPIFAPVPGPCSLPILLMEMDAWLDALLFKEDKAAALLDKLSGFYADWCNALLEAGGNGLVVTEGMASAQILPRDLFVLCLMDHIKQAFSRINGPIVFHATGGNIGHVADLIRDFPNLVGVTISSQDDIANIRESIGPGLTIIGNMSELDLPTMTRDQAYQAAQACLNQAKAAGGPFILANSGGDIPLDTPPENLTAMIEASRDFANKESV